MIAAIGRQLRGRFVDIVAISMLILVGTATLLVILNYQKAALPAWVPVLGQEFVSLDAEFTTGQAVMPGQGQAITIAGVRVGKITTVHLEDGKAIIGMNVEPEYAELIRTDAELLLRPKTNLNDMVIDVEPGLAEETIEPGSTIPVANTAPNVNPEEFINTLDGDTQQYLRMLLSAGAQGLAGDGGVQLGHAFRRFYPFVRDMAKLNKAVAQRRDSLARVIHNFGLLTEELGRNEQVVSRWVSSSSDVLGAFAQEAEAIRQSLRELPATLAVTNSAMETASELSLNLRPAMTELIPQARALGPAVDASAELFRESTPVIRDEVRPFTRQMLPVLREVNRGAEPLKETVEGFGNTIGELNYFFNLLAYNPGEQNPGYLFYLPWLNHNLNANYTTYDAAGPMRRGTVFLTCQTAYLARGLTGGQPFLDTVLRSTNLPPDSVLVEQLEERGINPYQDNGEDRYCATR